MTEKIIEYVRVHPNARRREIAGGINVWQCSREFMRAMRELVEAHVLTEITYRDMANMEICYLYRVN